MPPAGVYPKAVWRPVPQAAYAARIEPTAIVLHSNAGSGGDLYEWWTNPAAGGLYSHFQFPLDGTVYQYQSIFRRAPANVAANAFGISCETANNPGHGTFPGFNTDVWTDPQRKAIITAIDWVCTQTGIPRVACVDAVHGIGGHDWFASWTTRGHVCPGTARRDQIRTDIIPAVDRHLHVVEDDNMLTKEEAAQLAATRRDAAIAADQAPKAALYAAGANDRAARAINWGATGTLDTLYRLEVGRPIDPAGLDYWRNKITAGATVDQVQAAIHDTAEARRYREGTAA